MALLVSKKQFINLKWFRSTTLQTENVGGMIFYGAQWREETVFNEDTGFWHFECEIKDYPEDGKPKKSSELFKEAIPIIFEDGMKGNELYEEYRVATEYELQNGILKCTNEREIQRAINNRDYWW